MAIYVVFVDLEDFAVKKQAVLPTETRVPTLAILDTVKG